MVFVIIIFFIVKLSIVYSVIIIIKKKPRSSMEIAKRLFSLERSEGGNYALSKMDEKKSIYLSIN